jgi:HSP20 family molecular chaperone IbpA
MNESRDIEIQNPACCEAERTRRGWTYTPHVDVLETADAYVIEADMPGADRERIDLAVDDGVLTIQAPVVARSVQGDRLFRQEYGVGDFHRRFRLDRTIDVSRIDAAYEDGVLTVRLPKVAEAQPRKIEVR